MAYAKSSLIQDIRNFLDDNPWETTSTTAGTSTPVAVPDGTKWSAGDVGEWSYSGTVGGEQFLVQSVSANNLTVVRGYNGTTAEAHTSGDRVVKNPRYSVAAITDSIERVIDGLYPLAWKTVTTSVTPNQTSVWIDSGLTGADITNVIDLVTATQRYGGSNEYLATYGGARHNLRSLPVWVERNFPTSFITSGIAVRFPGGYHHATNAIAFIWRVKLTATISGSNYADLTEGLMTDAVVFGVVARLLMEKEIPNISESSRSDQSGPGTFVQMSQWYDFKKDEALGKLHAQLLTETPPAPDQNYLNPGW